jgi:hypothetical protein
MDGLVMKDSCYETPPKPHCVPGGALPGSQDDKVGHAGNGDWLRYDGFNFNGVTRFTLRSTAGMYPGVIEFRKDSVTGTLLAACEMTTTGGWDLYATSYCPSVTASGTGNLFVVFTGQSELIELPDLTWFTMQ